MIGPIAELSEAMKQVGRDGFDVAVVDINLRDEAAYSVADELVRQKIPFVFATGYDAEVIPDRFRSVKRWIKPYDLRNVVEDVAQLCNSRGEPNGRSRARR